MVVAPLFVHSYLYYATKLCVCPSPQVLTLQLLCIGLLMGKGPEGFVHHLDVEGQCFCKISGGVNKYKLGIS